MEKFCDLHTHSVFSDGFCTPSQIVEDAVRIGLAAVALTDHDSIDGLPEFLSAAADKPIQAIAGAEFAVIWEEIELHLLGLFIPSSSFSSIGSLMEQVHRRREDRVYDLVESLNRSGFRLDFNHLKQQAQGQVTRAHVAAAIEESGLMDAGTAFRTLLKPGAGHYTSPQRLPFLEVLDMLCDVGAVPVLAHPFLNMTHDQLVQFLPFAKTRGLIGMECIYSGYNAQTTEDAFALAKQCNLLPSGGSDFHGTIRPEAPLGNGNHPIPYSFCQALCPVVV